MDEFIFDPETVVDDSIVPEGTYDLVVDEVTFDKNKKGTGSILKIQTHVINGSQGVDGKWLWIRINLVHDSEQTQNIGRAQFKKFLSAVGHEGKFDIPKDLSSLKGKQMTCFVKVEEGFNVVKNFKKVDNLKF